MEPPRDRDTEDRATLSLDSSLCTTAHLPTQQGPVQNECFQKVNDRNLSISIGGANPAKQNERGRVTKGRERFRGHTTVPHEPFRFFIPPNPNEGLRPPFRNSFSCRFRALPSPLRRRRLAPKPPMLPSRLGGNASLRCPGAAPSPRLATTRCISSESHGRIGFVHCSGSKRHGRHRKKNDTFHLHESANVGVSFSPWQPCHVLVTHKMHIFFESSSTVFDFSPRSSVLSNVNHALNFTRISFPRP